ncbi:hypothetical protein PVAP13_8NG285700 [Panicum virgatum]|uniref:Uncharacterized protein n=1 Tax=Panicum virgatum TaxID=38727 RepID=A0A8T0PIK3_PANVG|nr:hypothetical protein PVAP13_8NG285700 [Panicum virgatum]
MVPERRLTASDKNSRTLSLPRPSGMEPSSWLYRKEISFSAERLASDGGIVPVKLFFSRCMALRLDKPPNQAGIRPASLFGPSFILSRLVQFFKLSCNSPWNELLDRSRNCNRDRRPISDGISPSKLFPLRFRVFKNVRLPMEGEIVPARPSEES